VNKKNGQPSISFVDFTPKKKSKGIVFYEERMEELKESPHLARGAVLLTAVKVESGVIAKEEAVILAVKKTRGKQKKTASIDSTVDINEEIITPAPALNIKTPTASRKRVKIESEVKALDFSSPLPVVKNKRMPRKPKSLVLGPSAPLVPECLNSDAGAPLEGSVAVAGRGDEVITDDSAGLDLPDTLTGLEGNSKVRTRSARKRTVDQTDSTLLVQ
jgi:hypothetical protein